MLLCMLPSGVSVFIIYTFSFSLLSGHFYLTLPYSLTLPAVMLAKTKSGDVSILYMYCIGGTENHMYIAKYFQYLIKINEPQLPWLRIPIYHTGIDVKMEVTQCTGHIFANTRCHQLRWGDRE